MKSQALFRVLMSLRARVIAVVLIASIPGVAALLVESRDHLDDITRAQHDEALHVARLVATDTGRRVNAYRAEIKTLLSVYAPTAEGIDECATDARRQIREEPGVINGGVVLPDGNLACSAVLAPASVSFGDRDWFRRARDTRDIVVSDRIVDRITKVPTLVYALAKRDARGKLVAIGFLTVEVAYLNSFIAPSGLPEGSVVTLTDDANTIIAAYPPAAEPVGASSRPYRATLKRADGTSGYVRIVEASGRKRSGAYALIPVGTPARHLTVFVGISAESAITNTNRLFWILLIVASGVLVGGMALAWVGGEVFLLRPAQAISVTACKLAGGDLSARTGLTEDKSELGLLAHDLDQMADELEGRTGSLERQRLRYQGLIENLPALVFEIDLSDPTQPMTVHNDPGFGEYGFAGVGSSIPVADFLQHIHPDDVESVLARIRRDVANAHIDAPLVYRLLGEAGKFRWVRAQTTWIGNPAEGRLQGVLFDVTEELERTETILRYAGRLEALSRLARSVLAASDFAAVAEEGLSKVRDMIDFDHACIGVWYDGAERCLALYPADAEPLFPPSEVREELERGEVVLGGSDTVTAYVPLVANQVVLGAFALRGPRAEFDEESMGFIEDVARQLALGLHQSLLVQALRREADLLEERVAARTSELREANGELSQFATTVAHDLRAPLRSMRGFSTALLEDYAPQLGAEGVDFARRIVAGADSMDRLIDDLLAYARTGPGAEVKVEQVDLDSVVREAVERVTGDILRTRALVKVDPGLGLALGTRLLLVAVVANLVQNAVTFVQGHLPEVHVRCEREGGRVRLIVDDNGVGVPEADRERIWGVFEGLHPRHVFPGTGVGLAIVAKAAARMGGSVGVDGREHGGSSFWIELRACADDEETA